VNVHARYGRSKSRVHKVALKVPKKLKKNTCTQNPNLRYTWYIKGNALQIQYAQCMSAKCHTMRGLGGDNGVVVPYFELLGHAPKYLARRFSPNWIAEKFWLLYQMKVH